MFSKLLSKIVKNKRNLLWIIVGVSLFFMMSDSVFAETVKTEAQRLADARTKVASFVGWLSTVITLFLSILTYLSTVFLSPEWINGSLFGLNGYFKSIWVLVSNFVYLSFAFILIWIAFMNIIGKGQEKYALKQALPKFIIGVLIVPFSWFFIQFILSISAVLTISALNLPFETFSTFSNKLSTTQIPQKCTLDFKSLGNPDNKNRTETEKVKSFIDCGGEKGKKISLDELRKSDKSVDSIFGVIGTYTYGILSLESMDKLNNYDVSNITNMADLVVKLLFDVLFIVVYSILIIAMGLVLMVRGIYIWMYMMMAPIFGLMYFFDKTSGGGEFFDKFNVKQFISLAFVPVYTMLALSFGLLFIYAAGNGMSYNGDYKDINTVKLDEPQGENGEQTLTVGQFSLKIIGSPSNPKNVTGFFDNISNKGMGVIGTLIMKIFGIVVLWGVLMAALRSNDITKAIVEPLHAFGTQVGGLVTKAPQYIPVFGGQSMKSLQTVASGVEGKISQYSTDRANKFLDKTPFGNDQVTKTNQDLQSKIITAQTPQQQAALMQEIIRNANGDEKNLFANTASQKALFDLVSKINPEFLKELKIEKATDINSLDKVAKIYEKVESKGPQFIGILPENNGKINPDAIKRAVKDAKNLQTIPTGLEGNQTINITMKESNLDSFIYKGDIDSKNSLVDQLYSQGIKQGGYKGKITKEEFIIELRALGLNNDGKIKTLIDELEAKDPDFFKNETPKT
ncbi:MAG: hypothetical protein PHH06_02830 [Candidatus Gracilibacteria bacterium]|nr:hypothetical protein [Candidatus Gracilibacteria bacterium]